MTDIWVVVPAFNETLEVLQSVLRPLVSRGYSVLLLDDGSEPPIPRSALPEEVMLLRHQTNRGQGAALRSAFHAALHQGARIIVTFDADGQHSAESIPPLVAAVESGADIALGSRFLRPEDARQVPLTRRLLLTAAILFTRIRTGLALTDTHNGLRALVASAARRITLTQDGSAHASELLDQIALLGLNHREVPVLIHYTPYSRRKGQRLVDAFLILLDLFTLRPRSRELSL